MMIVPPSVQAPTWGSNPPEVAPSVRETLDAIDAAETDVLRGRDDVAHSRALVPDGIKTAALGLAGIGAGTLLAMAGSAASAPVLVTAGVFVIAGAVIGFSGRSETRDARKALEEKERKLTDLTTQLEDRCAQERPAHEQSLQKAGPDSLAVMRHVETDPYVAVAADRYGHASRIVTRDRSILQMSRSDRFAARNVRADEIWRERADLIGIFGLLGVVGTLWTGMAVTTTINSAVPIVVSLAAAAGEWFGLKHLGHRLVAPSVDKRLKHELEAEVAWHEPRLDALRDARDTTKQSALEHYAALLAAAPQTSPGQVRVEDGRVVIGGVAVPRSGE